MSRSTTSSRSARPRKSVAIDPWKLIEAAEDFAKAKGGKGRPRAIWLRRAVSTAYYALYHAFSRGVAEQLLPGGSSDDQLRLTRPFRHGGFKGICGHIASRGGGGKSVKHLEPMVERLRKTELLDVAEVFFDLQEARHQADYDHLEAFSKQGTLGLVRVAKKALQTLESAQVEDREVFFALLAKSDR